MKSNSNQNAFKNMTQQEIITYLNSGNYIPESTKKMLQEKLKVESNNYYNNKYSVLDNPLFTETYPTQKKLHSFDKINNEEFPSLINQNHNNKNSNIDFIKIVEQKNIAKDEINSLFDDDKLILSFNDFKSLYDYCAIYRIRLQYLILNKKIQILTSIENIDANKGKLFKLKFKFNNMVLQESKLKNCLMIYMELEKIKSINMFQSENKLETKIYELIGNDSKYLPLLDEIMANINILDEKNKSIFYDNVTNLMNKIVNDNDPHIDCDYSITLIEKNEAKMFSNKNIINFANYSFVLNGLSDFVYCSCDQPIDLSTKNKIFDPVTLGYITEKWLMAFFNKKKNKSYDPISLQHFCDEWMTFYLAKKEKNIGNHFVKLYSPIFNQHSMNIYYFLNETIPKPKISVKIIDLPSNASKITSMLFNHKLKKNNNRLIIITPKNNKTKWLNCRTKNDLYKQTQDEYNFFERKYEYVKPIQKKNYSYEDSDKNIFVVDHLFNELLKNDVHDIVKPEMLESFRKLAKQNSNICR